jgi:peptidoglycan hydrolase FlgJ
VEKILKSVGQGGINLGSDVKIIQTLINRNLHQLKSLKPIEEDGLAGPKTIAAINEYQRYVLRLPLPNGLISPGDNTIKNLLLTARPSRPSNVSAFLSKVLPGAKRVKKKYGVPISILIAQAALESGWGTSVKGNAYFGIKGKSPQGESIEFTTTEFLKGKKIILKDTFRAYVDFSESADDYGQFLKKNNRYKKCFDFSSKPLIFADKLQEAGYATDPKYAEKLKNIIKKYYLDDYDR